MSGHKHTATANTSPPTQTSSSAGEDPILTPTSTPSSTPLRLHNSPLTQPSHYQASATMDDKGDSKLTEQKDVQQHQEPIAELSATKTEPETKPKDDATASAVQNKKQKESKCRNPEKHKAGKRMKKKVGRRGDKAEADDDDSEDDSDESDSSSSEEESKKLKKKKSKSKPKKSSRKNKNSAPDSDTESSDSEDSDNSGSSSSSEPGRKKSKSKSKSAKKAKEKKSKSKTLDDDEASESDGKSDKASENSTGSTKLHEQVAKLMRTLTESKSKSKGKSRRSGRKASKVKSKRDKKSSAQYKRVDQLWNDETHNYQLKESAEDDDSEFAEFAFLVRRTFNWKNEYQDTVIDIKSKQLRIVLTEVMKDCKSISMEAEEPVIDPKILFLYLEELRTYYKKTLKSKIKAEKKRKAIKKLEHQRMLLKTLVAFIDEDYEDTKKTLYPLLKAGNITFDLIWALFHPNEIAVTSTYGVWEQPRCFQVEYATKNCSFHRGDWYCIEGRYMEYDGKSFGFGDFEVDIDSFKGPRKITSLNTYPLKYHKDPEGVKKQIMARAERFINMEGMHYKFHKGLAFVKKKKQVLKININGRIMVDPGTFRRVNPNYPISFIKPKDADELVDLDGDDDDSEGGCSCCGDNSDDEAFGGNDELDPNLEAESVKYKYMPMELEQGHVIFERVEVDDDGQPIRRERIRRVSESGIERRTFTEEELLLTSPVVLGFAFSEKLWLEFTISGLSDIVYNEHAFDSLVLPANQKSIVRAQVESHKIYAAKTIDDVVQGKGKGLVAVLHGPPGTGKTLTAEGIAELLKCPLYMVSAGELGTDPGKLEQELQKILDIAHSWGAVLLLDEADVFLEKREVHDIHRNALVSIFLRLLEYFQGILFLTTNRVETFDDAFQSRIHIALRYGDLTHKAKKTVWKMFLDLARKTEMEVADLSDHELDVLARNKLNGRQIKNLVRTAQALALNEKKMLTLEHIKRVIDVAESFDHDLKGAGFVDAMRSYT